MPTISQFHGVEIVMYYNDHNPPHFHAYHGEEEALIEWRPPQVHKGYLRGKILRMVLKWAGMHAADLDDNWSRARQGQAVTSVDPLP